MEIITFISALELAGITFFTGVPDSLLSAFCDELARRYTDRGKHIVAHNEGGSVALASGYHLATGKIPCVYMQNSGIGNAFNPVASLTHPKVYGIPILFVVGWRGMPGAKDEPQHVFQGEVTLNLLASMDIEYFVMDKATSLGQIETTLLRYNELFAAGKSAAFVITEGVFSGNSYAHKNDFLLNREKAVEVTVQVAGNDPIVSTTGKITRELFEIRKKQMGGHEKDFLTVGSMGHCLMIALGISLGQPKLRVWCLDGDGALLMHMGSMGIIGSQFPEKFIHVVYNNAAHETVGGMPTCAGAIDLPAIALACGYSYAYRADNEQSLKEILEQAKNSRGPVFVEVQVALGSRPELGRPSTELLKSKYTFMQFLAESG